MADQKTQRQNLTSQAGDACKRFLRALHDLSELAEQRPFLGNFTDADFTGTELAYLDAATAGVLFDFVVPNLLANYLDVANSGRNKQILNQMVKAL